MSEKMPPAATLKAFQDQVKHYYHEHGRHTLDWRLPEDDGSFDPYKIMVSEIMLQQTQVNRVLTKYRQFLQTFPTLQTLAGAELSEVLRVWSGLGYNRRARFLHEAAQMITSRYQQFPQHQEALVSLPGIGANTAAAIRAYSFNQAVVFIETNIRTVYLHHFFRGREQVADSALTPLINATLDTAHPREWYWALMDYGTYIKSTISNPNRNSKHYTKQSAFEGSSRQVRGKVLRQLMASSQTLDQLKNSIEDVRLEAALLALESERLISKNGATYQLGR